MVSGSRDREVDRREGIDKERKIGNVVYACLQYTIRLGRITFVLIYEDAKRKPNGSFGIMFAEVS